LYLQEGTPLALFDAVEVDPVAEFEHGISRIDRSEIEQVRTENPDIVIFWSVYLHYDAKRQENKGFGGVECIADLPTEEAALAYAAGVEAALEAVRKAE
jgi:hypothetical protein